MRQRRFGARRHAAPGSLVTLRCGSSLRLTRTEHLQESSKGPSVVRLMGSKRGGIELVCEGRAGHAALGQRTGCSAHGASGPLGSRRKLDSASWAGAISPGLRFRAEAAVVVVTVGPGNSLDEQVFRTVRSFRPGDLSEHPARRLPVARASARGQHPVQDVHQFGCGQCKQLIRKCLPRVIIKHEAQSRAGHSAPARKLHSALSAWESASFGRVCQLTRGAAGP